MGGLPAPGHMVPVIPGPAPGYPLIPGPRVPLLDSLRSTKGIYSEFYDPDGAVYGLPTYPYRWAPAIYATRLALLARMTCPVCGVANTGELRPELRGLPQDEFIKTFVAHAPDLTTEQETQLLVSLGLLSDSAVVSAA
jgi:hypothetical protein